MKLSCNVVRDLLPLYHDGVCGDESRALVEDHLKECPDCTAILRELRGEIELAHGVPDDGAVLKKLEMNVRKGKKKAILLGAGAVLALVLLLTAGIYGHWYMDTRGFYLQGADGHEPHYDSNIYQWSEGDYYFRVEVPEHPGTGGSLYVHLITVQNALNIVPGEEITTWLNIGREEYTYLVGLEVRTRTQIAGEPRLKTEVWTEYLMLDQELNLLYADYMDEEDRARQNQVFMDYNQEIMEIIEAARTEWPFLTEE